MALNASFTPSYKAPTVQRITTGSGNYTAPAGVKYLEVDLIGGGGGGAGGYIKAYIPNPLSINGGVFAYSIGAGGAAGIAGSGGLAGGAGGSGVIIVKEFY